MPSKGRLNYLSNGEPSVSEVVLHCWVGKAVVAVGVREMVVVAVQEWLRRCLAVSWQGKEFEQILSYNINGDLTTQRKPQEVAQTDYYTGTIKNSLIPVFGLTSREGEWI